MFELIRSAIMPSLSLHECLHHWPELAKALREAPRKRTQQSDTMETPTSFGWRLWGFGLGCRPVPLEGTRQDGVLIAGWDK